MMVSADTAAMNERECALLARIAGRDQTAINELYLLYHRRLAGFLMRLTSRHELAEEIINDTFWVVWQHAGDFRGASRVSTWIFGIAYRRSLKTLRHAGPPPVDTGLEAAVGSEEPAQQEEIGEWLDAALQRLPLEQRMVIGLAYHVGHSCEEIASIMQCPVNTVKTRMFQARRKLKTLLINLAGPPLDASSRGQGNGARDAVRGIPGKFIESCALRVEAARRVIYCIIER